MPLQSARATTPGIVARSRSTESAIRKASVHSEQDHAPAMRRRQPISERQQPRRRAPAADAPPAARRIILHARPAEPGGDAVERGRQQHQHQTGPRPTIGESRPRPRAVSTAAMPPTARGPTGRRQEREAAARSSGASSREAQPPRVSVALGDDPPLELGEIGAAVEDRDRPVGGDMARAGLERAAQQGRLQVPVAQHRRGLAQQRAVDRGEPGPARVGVDPLVKLAEARRRARSAPLVPRPAASRASWSASAIAPSATSSSRSIGIDRLGRLLGAAGDAGPARGRGAGARSRRSEPAGMRSTKTTIGIGAGGGGEPRLALDHGAAGERQGRAQTRPASPDS